MKTVKLNDAKQSLASYAKKVGKEPLVFVRRGKPVVALVNIEDSDWESISIANNPKFLKIIDASRERQRREGGITSDELRKRLGLPPAKRRGSATRKKK